MKKILQESLIIIIKIKTPLVDRKYLLTNIRKIKRFICVNVFSPEQILAVKYWLTLKKKQLQHQNFQ